MHRVAVALSAFVLAVCLTACGDAQSTSQTPSMKHLDLSWANAANTVAGMASNSDAVAKITIVAVAGTGEDPDPYQPTPYTLFTASVSRWLMGAAGTDQITIKQTGDSTLQADDDPLLQVGESAVVFLHQYAEGKYFIVGGPTGRFHLDAQQHLVPMPGGQLDDHQTLSDLANELPAK